MRDREETITAPDGKEYPIRDNEQKIMNDITLNDDNTFTVYGKKLKITNTHCFDDFGKTLDTITLEDGTEVYSYDEGGSWTTHFYGGEDYQNDNRKQNTKSRR